MTPKAVKDLANLPIKQTKELKAAKGDLGKTTEYVYNQLPKEGKRDKSYFGTLVYKHYEVGSQPDKVWAFLERGARAKKEHGSLHYKAWEAYVNIPSTQSFLVLRARV